MHKPDDATDAIDAADAAAADDAAADATGRLVRLGGGDVAYGEVVRQGVDHQLVHAGVQRLPLVVGSHLDLGFRA